MSSTRLDRLVPLSGVLFGLCAFAGLLVGAETPDATASPTKVVIYFATHRSESESSSILFAIAFLFFLFFAAALRSYLRDGERRGGPAALVLAGAVVMTSGALTASVMEYTLAHDLGSLTPSTAQVLNLLSNQIGTIMLVGGGVAVMVASAAAILSGAALPRWLGWAALAIGILALILPIAFLALLLLLIWTVVVSILMYLRLGGAEAGGGTGELAGTPPAA